MIIIFASQGSSSNGNDDEDLIMTEDTQTFIDPWTRKTITDDPITNKKCGHTYEKSVVMRFLDSKKTVKCPVVGCNNNKITKADLYSDASIKKKIMMQNRSRR